MPKQIADLDDTVFQCEINSSMDTGRLIMRYGLLPDQTPEYSQITFRFDCDRFVNSALSVDQIDNISSQFVSDLYQAFTSARGSALRRWMEGESETTKELAK